MLLTGLAIIFLLFYLGSGYVYEQEQKSIQAWKNIKVGDSIFVKNNIYSLKFYKKGRQELASYEQKEINYRRTDTLSFIRQNTVHEKYFYQNRTSFVGICLGKDSSITKQGSYNKNRWLMIIPSYEIAHPPKSDKYDYDSREWQDNSTDYFAIGNLSKDFFISFDDVTTINNDSIFR